MGSAQVNVLLTEGNASCCVADRGFGLTVSMEGIDVLLAAIAILASVISPLRRCNSSVVGSDVLHFGGFSRWWNTSSVISGIGGQKSSTFCCASVAAASSGVSCCFPLGFWLVGVLGEFWAVNMGDTASSRIQVTFATLSSREQDEVNRSSDRSSRRGPTRSRRLLVIVAIHADRIGGWVHMISVRLCRFRSA